MFQTDDVSPVRPASAMVRCALDRWTGRNLRADNTSVVVVMIDTVTNIPRERSASSASTVSVNSNKRLSESDEDLSESELSDSDFIDTFAPDIDMDDDSDEEMEGFDLENSNGTAHLPCFGGVGLTRTPPCQLTRAGSRPELRKLLGLKRFSSKLPESSPKVPPKRPIFRGRPISFVGSAPAKLSGNHHKFRGICKSSPFQQIKAAGKALQQGSPTAPFMDPGFKSPSTSGAVKTPTKSNVDLLGPNNGASPVLATTSSAGDISKRTLRPKSPRLMGENMLSNGASTSLTNASTPADKKPVTPGATDTPKPSEPTSPSPVAQSLEFMQPKEATSPKSPVKPSPSMKGSPSAGLVSPIWPSDLELASEMDAAPAGENEVPSPTPSPSSSTSETPDNNQPSIDSEGTENIEHPKTASPRKGPNLKRKSSSPAPAKLVKKLKSSTPQKAVISSGSRGSSNTIRTRGQLKSLSPHKNSSPKKSVTPRKTKSS